MTIDCNFDLDATQKNDLFLDLTNFQLVFFLRSILEVKNR